MGMSVDFHIYDIEKLKANIEKEVTVKEDQMSVPELLDKVMPVAGEVFDKYFAVQSCDYWDEYDPWSAIQRLLESYYQNGDLYRAFSDAQVAWKYEGADVEKLAESAGIEDLPSHPDDEEEEEDE